MKGAPSIALVANWDWVLYNFRLPIARALRERGCHVTLVCPAGEYVDRLRAEHFDYVEWPLTRRSLNLLHEVHAVRALIRIYRRNRFDIVHHFTIKPNLYGSLAAWLAETPGIINTFSGLGFVFSGGFKARLVRYPVGMMMRFLMKRRRIWTIFQNDVDYTRLCGQGWADAARSVLIPGSGADLLRFFPPAADLRPSHPRLRALFAGRLLRDKGVEQFALAAAKLRDRGIEAEFWIAGASDPGNPNTVSATDLSRWRSSGAITVLGHRSDMGELLRDVDVAVLPTTYAEGLPKFLLEAAATGLPLIASDIPGCRLIVRHGINGLLVPPGDVDALAQALERLFSEADLRARFGSASLEIATQEFSETRIVDQYLQLYERLMGLPHRAATA